MESEVENILSGTVERRYEGDKAIGVSSTNLTPGPDGIPPLSRQGAFTSDVSMNTPTIPSDGANMDVAAMPDSQNPIAAASVNETITEAPVTVESPDKLGGFDVSFQKVADTPFVDTPKADVTDPVSDILLPDMPQQIPAQEPDKVNSDLFASGLTAPAPAQSTTALENPLESMGEMKPQGEIETDVLKPNSSEIDMSAYAMTNPELAKDVDLTGVVQTQIDETFSPRLNDYSEFSAPLPEGTEGEAKKFTAPNFPSPESIQQFIDTDIKEFKEKIDGLIDEFKVGLKTKDQSADVSEKQQTKEKSSDLQSLPELPTDSAPMDYQTDEIIGENSTTEVSADDALNEANVQDAPAPAPVQQTGDPAIDSLMLDAMNSISGIGAGASDDIQVDSTQIQGKFLNM